MEEKKVKIKELVGKGLGSYHTKVKQQIDRIEKKNKEQNHKISILTNELDNDYLTKTEEGSVISLEHSKEGMVYIDGLEGNTLVNYCTDGAKEMTLNGDIDLEGTFVTTTEGVDGGKVDVYCEGNTMINHCTDGAKELTLNGEIDASGTFITTTEGTDGGKVDVYCEGNTLVNLVPQESVYSARYPNGNPDNITITTVNDKYVKANIPNELANYLYFAVPIDTSRLKTNTDYTLICETKGVYFLSLCSGDRTQIASNDVSVSTTEGLKKILVTTNDFSKIDNTKQIFFYARIPLTSSGDMYFKNAIILEGDWTNKEIPAYFEGMKSVGQDDTNGHGIKLTSRNKNLFDMDRLSNTSTSAVTNFVKNKETGRLEISYKANSGYPYLYYYLTSDEVEIFRGKKVFIKRDIIQYDAKLNHTIQLFVSNSDGTTSWITDEKIVPSNAISIKLQVHGHNSPSSAVTTDGTTIYENIYIGIDEPSINYTYNKINTLSIPLSAPLRGLPNGVKDKFVKKEGKWYVERNCGEVVLNGSESWGIANWNTQINSTAYFISRSKYPNSKSSIAVTDKFPCVEEGTMGNIDKVNICGTTQTALISFRVDKTYTLETFKAWLSQNPVTVIYQLATPTYEPIENVELITYLETTHISNNSLIPCNMVIKNTGYNTIAIKPSTLYTVALDKNGSETMSVNLCGATATTTTNTLTLTTPATLTSDLLTLSGKGVKGSKIRLLEGDKSGEIPGYFEGMKSVGELEGNSVEVLSQNNLADIATSGDNANFNIANLKAGKTYTIKSKRSDSSVGYNLLLGEMEDPSTFITREKLVVGVYGNCYTFTPTKSGILRFNGYSNPLNVSEIMLVEGTYTNSTMPQFKPYASNTKQIPLSAPLRGLPNGVKDRFVKIGGKWYIERNCGNHTITSNSNIEKHSSSSESMLLLQVWSITPTPGGGNNIISDSLFGNKNSWTNPYHIYQSGGTILFSVPTTVFPTLTDFKTWLSNNPFNIIYQLATPTYEPLEDVELTTYLDTTHISNNSLIPCNMQVKNTGYNAIIKPSTLYTVALDTNKPGTIGMNLGGVKGTTTNNVLTLTTPATLTDDSLRVYGKDIKGSKIRLLEGDKTNWIPSFFEGMKSSFEDKFDTTDNTYKMEILSKNKNVFNINEIENTFHSYLNGMKFEKLNSNSFRIYNTNGNAWQNGNSYVKLKPNTTYKVSYTMINKGSYGSLKMYRMYNASDYTNKFVYFDNIQTTGTHTFNKIIQTDYSGIVAIQLNSSRNIAESNEVVFEDFYISEISTDFIYSKSNKIQFSSIEPLRKWDRFVFKDGKLMIERNSKQIKVDNTLSWSYSTTRDNLIEFYAHGVNEPSGLAPCICDKFNTYDAAYLEKLVISGNTLYIQIHKSKLPTLDISGIKEWLKINPLKVVYKSAEPTYEEIPYELQKIILEGYEGGTLFIDTNIPPTVTTTYAGQTPIVSTVNESEVAVASVTSDINDIIVPYLCDMDYRIVALQLQNEPVATMNTYKLLGSTYDMIKRDILSKRYSSMEYLNRMSDYHSLGRITDSELDELKQVVAEVFNDEQN